MYGESESGAIAATALTVLVPMMYVIWYVLLTVCCSAYAKVLCVSVSLVCCSMVLLWVCCGQFWGHVVATHVDIYIFFSACELS